MRIKLTDEDISWDIWQNGDLKLDINIGKNPTMEDYEFFKKQIPDGSDWTNVFS